MQDTLNQKLFNSDNMLHKEVRDKLLNIVDYFTDNLDFKIKVLDVYLLGSNASYNYNEHSDIDLHIVTNFEDYDASIELVKALFNSLKSNFNDEYDIKVRGLEVELYIEDINTSATSNGVYSVLNNEWIKFPTKDTVIVKDVSDKASHLVSKLNDVLQNGTYDDIVNAINQLYLMRKNSILSDGEYGTGNLIFKHIRNIGLLKGLKNKKKELKQDDLSLKEKISNAVFVSDLFKLM